MSEADKKAASVVNSLLRFVALRPLMIGVMVAMIIVAIIICLLLYQVLIAEPRNQQIHTASQNHAAAQAKQVDAFVAEQGALVDDLVQRAAGDEALKTGEADSLRNLENRLQAEFPSASYLYLLEEDDTRLEQERNFAAYDLVLRAHRGEKPGVEAALVEGHWLLQWAAVIPQPEATGGAAGDQPTSVALALGTTVKPLQSVLAQLNINLGQTRLEQRIGNFDPVAFVVAGQGDDAGTFIGEAATSTPNWKIRYIAAPHMLETATRYQRSYWILVVTIVIELGLFIFYRGIRQFYSDLQAGALKTKRPKISKDEDEAMRYQAARSFLDSVPQKPLSADAQDLPGNAEQSSSETATLPGTKDGGGSPDHGNEVGNRPGHQSGIPLSAGIPQDIFREYDIRGVVDRQLDADLARKIGAAIGSEAVNCGQTSIVVGHDGRLSSPKLYEALSVGILASGCNVILQGMVPTPLLYFAAEQLDETNSGVMVTGSHNPPEYNGFKVVIDGDVLSGSRVTDLYRRILNDDVHFGEGERSSCDVTEDYISRILGDIVPGGGIKVVIDAGNGVAGPLAVEVLSAIGCDVIPLNCEVDGNFPKHPPDPTVPENLRELAAAVRRESADLGIALDGDGDRVVGMTGSGRIVWPDELLMIFARDVLARTPGSDIVYDVKCTRRLKDWISNHGGRPVMGKTGHANMRHQIGESRATLGGEFSGHMFFPDRWFNFDDGIYAAARLIEILVMREQSLDQVLEVLPPSCSTPEIVVPVGEEEKFAIVEKLVAENGFKDAKLTTLDGLLAEFPGARGLVRASKTMPALSMRFEADDEESLTQVRQRFKRELQRIAPDIDF